jgi:hypothetical protein
VVSDFVSGAYLLSLPSRRDLGDLLLEERIITEGVLRAARRLAKRERLPMVVVLLEEEHLSEQQLVDLLMRRLKLPVIDLGHGDRLEIDEDVLREVPYDLAEKHRVLPLSLVSDPRGGPSRLRLAMADPMDREALDELEALVGKPLDPVIAPAMALAAAIRFRYRGAITRLTQPPRPRLLAKEEGPPSARTPRPAEVALPDERVTQPILRIDEEVPLEVRVKALTVMLIEAGVISERAYTDLLRKLLKDGSEP